MINNNFRNNDLDPLDKLLAYGLVISLQAFGWLLITTLILDILCVAFNVPPTTNGGYVIGVGVWNLTFLHLAQSIYPEPTCLSGKTLLKFCDRIAGIIKKVKD